MFLPDNIDFAQSETYILSIRLTPSGFYFSIHSPTDNTVFYQNNVLFSPNITYLKNIKKLIFDFSFFSNNFLQINVIYVSDKFTLVPKEYYSKKFELELYSFNFLNSELRILSDEIKELDCTSIWGIDEELHGFLSRTLLNPNFENHLSVLLSLFYQLHNKETSALYVNFNEDKMIDVVAFSKEKLILATTFVAKDPLEGCYFIQKTWEVLKLDVRSDYLFYSGKKDNHTDCIETLKKIVPNTESLSINIANELGVNKSETPTEILYQLCEL